VAHGRIVGSPEKLADNVISDVKRRVEENYGKLIRNS